MQGYYVVEPGPRPADNPFILHGDDKPRSPTLISHHMEVHGAELCLQGSSLHLHFLRLIMDLIPFHEAITSGSAPDALYHRKELGQLYNCIGCQLVKLHPKFEQDLHKSRLGRHAEPGHKKFFEDDGFVIRRLQDYLLSRCLSDTFRKEPKGDQLSNSASCHGRRTKLVAARGLTRILGSTSIIL
jgi:hypothetical protein